MNSRKSIDSEDNLARFSIKIEKLVELTQKKMKISIEFPFLGLQDNKVCPKKKSLKLNHFISKFLSLSFY